MNPNHAITIPASHIRSAGEPVFPHLYERFAHNARITALLKAREEYGIGKYGQTLKTDDDRDTVTEIINEMLDLLAYTQKLYLQRPSAYVRIILDDTCNHVEDMIAMLVEVAP